MTRSSPVSRGSAGRGAATLAFVCALFASAASAQTGGAAPDREAEARAHFRLSQSHYELGHFAEAAAELEQAYALSPRADLLYNLYVARRDAGQLAAAASALRQYLDEGEDIENAALLRHRLSALEAQLAAGEASAVGEADTSSEAGANGDAGATTDGAEREDSTEAGGEASRGDTGEAAPETSPAASEPSRSPSPVGYAVIGVGAAALVAGLVTAGLALDRYGALEATCGADHSCPPGTEAQRDEGVALATSTDVLLVSGGVIAAVGVVLLFTVLDEAPAAPPVSASCDASGCRATATFSF